MTHCIFIIYCLGKNDCAFGKVVSVSFAGRVSLTSTFSKYLKERFKVLGLGKLQKASLLLLLFLYPPKTVRKRDQRIGGGDE